LIATARCPCRGLGCGPVGFVTRFHFSMGAAMSVHISLWLTTSRLYMLRITETVYVEDMQVALNQTGSTIILDIYFPFISSRHCHISTDGTSRNSLSLSRGGIRVVILREIILTMYDVELVKWGNITHLHKVCITHALYLRRATNPKKIS
jgi:hypothetical protein